MRKTFSNCPACRNELYISEYSCPKCGTVIKGKFELDEFFKLSEDQLLFLKIFLKNRGNLSELQKELGISYPTAKNRLEEIVMSMGFEVEESKEKTEAQKILEMLDQNKITSKEAMDMLRNLKDKEIKE